MFISFGELQRFELRLDLCLTELKSRFFARMASPGSVKTIHIAIVGGGIGGAILGIGLAQFPHITFTIYESRGAFGESKFPQQIRIISLSSSSSRRNEICSNTTPF